MCSQKVFSVFYRAPLVTYCALWVSRLIANFVFCFSLLAGCKSSCMVYMDGKGTKISEHFRKDPQVAQVLETLQL